MKTVSNTEHEIYGVPAGNLKAFFSLAGNRLAQTATGAANRENVIQAGIAGVMMHSVISKIPGVRAFGEKLAVQALDDEIGDAMTVPSNLRIARAYVRGSGLANSDYAKRLSKNLPNLSRLIALTAA